MNDLISRAAAIDALKNTHFLGAPYVDAGISIALGVICDLPSAQPEVAKGTNVPTNDCISREEAIDAIREIRAIKGTSDDKILLIDKADAQTKLMMLPSTQPEREKGKWIEAYDPFNRISGRCSACGWEAHLYEDDVIGMNYCPNCGADMRGKQDD